MSEQLALCFEPISLCATVRRAASEKREAVLARLRKGLLSTVEAEQITHRGQATIGELRERGYLIRLVNYDGLEYYDLAGFQPKIKVTREMRDAYYQTPHWRGKSAERRRIDRNACTQCKARESLEVHHLRYALFEEDAVEDLRTLCAECHEREHAAIAGSQVHFPRFVTEEVARRIEAEL